MRARASRLWQADAVAQFPANSLACYAARPPAHRVPDVTVGADAGMISEGARRRDNGFMAAIVGIACDKGVSGLIGDGYNRWPGAHRLDAAHLFRLA